MRWAVLGAGGVGGYYGGLLARAGHDVRLYARGPHLAAIREHGLLVRSPGEAFVARLTATDHAAELGDVDLVLVAVKSYALADVGPVAAGLAAGGAAVLPLLNGIGIREALAACGVPDGATLGGITFISVARTAPGKVERFSSFHRVILGEYDHATTPRAQAAVAALTGAGVEARLSERIEVELWQKVIFISAMAAACGLTRAPIGPVREAPLGRRLIDRAVHEAAAVARAAGVAIPDDEEARTVEFIEALAPGLKPSFLLDLERGGPTEVGVLSGAIARLGDRFGIATPIHDAVTAAAGASRGEKPPVPPPRF